MSCDAPSKRRSIFQPFSDDDHSPVPFTVFDDLAIVVYDKANPDPAALRLACAWARWIVQRNAGGADDAFDVEAAAQADELHYDLVELIKRIELAIGPGLVVFLGGDRSSG